MYILGIESSCDDTSVALVYAHDGIFDIVAEKTASQIEIHKIYGGVVPEIAGRKHADAILPVIQEVMSHADIKKPDLIAVTSGPGLITGLLVGVEVAKNLSYLWGIPLVSVNHIEGHIHSVLLPHNRDTTAVDILFPAVSLIVSGGHTELLLMKDHGDYTLIGKTRDDAAGEAFDKVAKMIGFAYPGGPRISKHGVAGDPAAIDFPRPMLKKDGFDFSFAGLKTAALYWLKDNAEQDSESGTFYLTDTMKDDFCASYEQAIVDVLIAKTQKAIKKYNARSLILAGGVSANRKLRMTLEEEMHDVSFYLPASKYCMDNGAMIAVAGYYKSRREAYTPWQKLVADPNWKIYESH